MKLLAWVCGCCLLLGSASAFGGPIYRAGEPSSVANSLLHGELSAGYLVTSNRIKYVTGENDSSRLKGGAIRALWSPLPWLAVGAELDKLGDEKLDPMVKSYQVTRQEGVIKLTLSPNTTPRFYIIGGYGKSKHKVQYDHSFFPVRLAPAVTKNWNYWRAGIGLEADVWKWFFVALEGNYIHYAHSELTQLLKIDSRTETSLQVRLGLRF